MVCVCVCQSKRNKEIRHQFAHHANVNSYSASIDIQLLNIIPTA